MVTKKKTSTNAKKAKEIDSSSNANKFVLLRDLSSQMLLILSHNSISSTKTTKIGVGSEVMYVTTNRIRGRGTILLVGEEDECVELLAVLEKGHGSNNDNDSSPGLSIDEAESEEETLAEASVQSTSKENQSSAVTNQAVPKNASTSSTDSDKSPAENRHRTSPLQNKRTNENSENVSVSKRSKVNDDSSDKYLRGRILSLQEENKKLKEKIEDMESNWMPRPDQNTISYFAKIVSICTGDKDYEDNKGERFIKIMETLAMSEAELGECVDERSIRSTCRKVLRVVFKEELRDPSIRFANILERKDKLAAIRDFGRLMHPVESPKFTNGELNNAIGSDFYQRDRGIKQQQDQGKRKDDEAESSDDSEGSND